MVKEKSFWKIVLSFGILYSIFGMLSMLLTEPTAPNDNIKNSIVTYIAIIAFIATFFFEIKHYKKKVSTLKLETAIKLAVITGLVGGFILTFFSYYYYSHLHPEYVDFVREEGMKKIANKSPEEIEDQKKIIYFLAQIPVISFFQIFLGAFFGLIGGLVGGLFLKTQNEEYY